ncbi:hypothetical protein KAR34_13150 [bacterium]|nr:hypothetical protein [bacterium]
MKKSLIISLVGCALSIGTPATQSWAEVNVSSKYESKLYGYLHLSMSYDSHYIYSGNMAFWALPEGDTKTNDNELNITASQTRLGYSITGPEIAGAATKGKIEVDFYGLGGTENKAMLRMRHAFMEVVWPKGCSLLAGQTWDLMMTQCPTTVNFPVNWYAGNIGHRRPQLRLTKVMDMGEGSKLAAKLALARTIGLSNSFSPGDTGEDSGIPTVQTSVRYSSKAFEVGVSGHFGQEEYDTAADGTHDVYKTWSGRLDVNIPMGIFGFKASAWTGTNMSAYLGGIGQGVNLTEKWTIDAIGGWAMIKAGPINVGGGIDVPKVDQIASGEKQQNVGIFINTFQKLHAAVKVGMELSYWQTMYKDAADGDAVRAQVAFIHEF